MTTKAIPAEASNVRLNDERTVLIQRRFRPSNAPDGRSDGFSFGEGGMGSIGEPTIHEDCVRIAIDDPGVRSLSLLWGPSHSYTGTLAAYRAPNPDGTTSVAWMFDAAELLALALGDDKRFRVTEVFPQPMYRNYCDLFREPAAEPSDTRHGGYDLLDILTGGFAK
jgi:hypothetical protein